MKKCYSFVLCTWLIVFLCMSSYQIEHYDIDSTSFSTDQILEEKKEQIDEVETDSTSIETDIKQEQESIPSPSPEIPVLKEEPKIDVDLSIKEEPEKEEEKFAPNGAPLQLVGALSGYGIDCDGCSTNTASGHSIKDSIYYDDATYGHIRILSADKVYPFGTIVKISNCSYLGEEVIGIVLDRGGGVGLSKRVQFDLLYETEQETNPLGIQRNVTFTILRFGY